MARSRSEYVNIINSFVKKYESALKQWVEKWRKYSPDDVKRELVKVELVDNGKRYIILKRNTGVGMSPQYFFDTEGGMVFGTYGTSIDKNKVIGDIISFGNRFKLDRHGDVVLNENTIHLSEIKKIIHEEVGRVLHEAGRLGLHLMKNPKGTYSFVGSVPAELGYTEKDGSPLTSKTKKDLQHASNPSMIAKSRIFKTKDEAVLAAKKLGYSINSIVGEK